jgi:exosome complex exonuclease RRP6
MADWRIRPIPEEMLFYARSDTHFLLYVYDSLRNALIARASRTPSPVDSDGEGTSKPNPQRAIRRVLEKSAETALKLYSRDPYDHDKGIGMNGWGNLAKKLGKKVAADETLFVFQRLHFWRDNIAREMDESPQ